MIPIREADYVWRRQETVEGGTITSPVSLFGDDEITVRFRCAECQDWVYVEERTPVPNFGADSMEQSDNLVGVLVDCEGCGDDYDVSIYNGMGGMLIQISDIDDGDVWFTLGEASPIEHFFAGISDIQGVAREVLPTIAAEQKAILSSLLYVYGLAVFEAFLEDVLTQFLRSDQEAFRNFVEAYTWPRHSKLELADIYRENEQLPKKVFDDVISRTVFHDLPKVAALYRCAGLPDFPDFGEVMKIAAKRHVLVHRAGRNRDGSRLAISQEDLNGALKTLQDFVRELYEALPAVIKEAEG